MRHLPRQRARHHRAAVPPHVHVPRCAACSSNPTDPTTTDGGQEESSFWWCSMQPAESAADVCKPAWVVWQASCAPCLMCCCFLCRRVRAGAAQADAAVSHLPQPCGVAAAHPAGQQERRRRCAPGQGRSALQDSGACPASRAYRRSSGLSPVRTRNLGCSYSWLGAWGVCAGEPAEGTLRRPGPTGTTM